MIATMQRKSGQVSNFPRLPTLESSFNAHAHGPGPSPPGTVPVKTESTDILSVALQASHGVSNEIAQIVISKIGVRFLFRGGRRCSVLSTFPTVTAPGTPAVRPRRHGSVQLGPSLPAQLVAERKRRADPEVAWRAQERRGLEAHARQWRQ
jgi:hypothetical protein